MTLQYNRSQYDNDWQEHSLGAVLLDTGAAAQNIKLTNALGYRPDGTPAYEFDSRGVFQYGVIADSVNSWAGPNNNPLLNHANGYPTTGTDGQPMLNWFCYTWSAANCPSTRGMGLSADTRFSSQTNLTQDLSLNVRWDVSERVGLNFDVQKIKSEVDNFDNSTDAKTATNLSLDLRGGKPKLNFLLPTGFGMTAGGFADPANYYHEWTMEHTENSDGDELAARIDADIKLDTGWLDALRVGVRRAEREQHVNWSKYNWGSVQPLWGVENDDAFFVGQGRWQGTTEPINLGSNLVGGGVFPGGTFIHPVMSVVANYQNNIDTFGGHSHDWVPLGQRTACHVNPNSPEGLYCDVEQQKVTEDTDAAYVMLKFGGDDTKLGSVSFKGNIGVRWVKTSVTAAGGIQYPLWSPPAPQPPPAPGQPVHTDPLSLTPADDIAFMNGATLAQDGGADHTNWLPSLNLRFGLTDDMFIRFAASKALARPDMGLYKNYLQVSRVGPDCVSGTVTYNPPGDCQGNPVAYQPQYTSSAGNPALAPTTADQLDLTWEYYFSSTGQFSVALFAKKFHDYIQYGDFIRTFTNNGVTRDIDVTGPNTGQGAKLRGFELAYQQFFDALPEPWNGLGVQANYTYVDNNGISNSNLSIVSGSGATQQDPKITFTDLPLEGLSPETYNLVLMFERPKFGARLAWNWRSQYLISQSDCCIKLPIWQDSYGQLDGSFHYRPSDSWDMYLEAQNLLKAETVLKQQVNQDGLKLARSWFTNDRRLQIGVRYHIQ